MKKKILLALLAIAACFACTFTLAACGEWETTLAPTCTDDGVKERECSCGDKQTEKIDKLGHDFKNYVHNGKQ